MTVRSFVIMTLLLAVSAHSAPPGAEVYSGEPLAEALYDLATAATPVAYELSSASAPMRTDVFRLHDGRLGAVTARAKKFGEPYSIETLRVTPSATVKLTKQLPTVPAVALRKWRLQRTANAGVEAVRVRDSFRFALARWALRAGAGAFIEETAPLEEPCRSPPAWSGRAVA